MANEEFKSARDFLLAVRDNYDFARARFRWPRPKHFNWALDWFDDELARGASANATALLIISGDEPERYTFSDLSEASNRVANGLRGLGAKRGDRLLLMLGNVAPLWISMLAVIKLGLVVIPATPQLTSADVEERLTRSRAKFVIADAVDSAKFDNLAQATTRIAVGRDAPAGWTPFAELLKGGRSFTPEVKTKADEPMLLYFTSGTTSRPKLVVHSHSSYPIGHLSTMYGLRLLPGDKHFNISSPGWAKHAWSNFFAPWNAGACVVALHRRFEPTTVLDDLVKYEIDSFCGPPTVWRQLIQLDLAQWKVNLREVSSSGEPLNPEVIESVGRAWGLQLRDSFGQTELTMVIGNSTGQPIVVGAMGRPMPGYRLVLLDGENLEADHGEICLPLAARPAGLMLGYLSDDGALTPVTGDYYRTGDIANRDANGYITYVGRDDDVFKSSDYRLSPFELESALLEHEAIAEVAVVPAPEATRLTVPKAYVTLAENAPSTRETARMIFQFIDRRLAPYKRVRRLEFADPPKTLSGKIRRAQLRERENELYERHERAPEEFRIEDFADL